MKLRGVAWDVDGTLVDSEPLHHSVLIDICLAHGLDLRADPPDRFLGVHMDDVWKALEPQLPGIARQDWLDAIQDRFCDRAAEAAPMPHARDVMRALHDAGIPQVAVSNSGRRVVEANLAALGARSLLVDAITLDDVTDGKPAPEPYLRGAEILGLAPAEVLAVEDSGTGTVSALCAGLQVAFLGAPPEGAFEVTDLRGVAALFDL